MKFWIWFIPLIVGFAVLLAIVLLSGCAAVDPHSVSHTFSNWRVESEMYSVEWANGLPTQHGHLTNGEPYETGK